MNRSESIAAIAAALAKAQGAIQARRRTARIRTSRRNMPIWRASGWRAGKPLSANGIAVVQAPGECAEGRIWLTTELLHSSGEWISEVLSIPLAKVDAHGLGSAITYGRRYALAAMVGVAPDDDDGNAAVAQGVAENAAPRRGAPLAPFPKGPCPNITSLKTAARNFMLEIEAVSSATHDLDQFDIWTDTERALQEQTAVALPTWYEGGTRSSGETFEGMADLIARKRAELVANSATNPLVSG